MNKKKHLFLKDILKINISNKLLNFQLILLFQLKKHFIYWGWGWGFVSEFLHFDRLMCLANDLGEFSGNFERNSLSVLSITVLTVRFIEAN